MKAEKLLPVKAAKLLLVKAAKLLLVGGEAAAVKVVKLLLVKVVKPPPRPVSPVAETDEGFRIGLPDYRTEPRFLWLLAAMGAALVVFMEERESTS